MYRFSCRERRRQWYWWGACTCGDLIPQAIYVIPKYICICIISPAENGEDSGIGEGHVRVMLYPYIYIYIYMYFPLTENGEDSGIGEGHVRYVIPISIYICTFLWQRTERTVVSVRAMYVMLYPYIYIYVLSSDREQRGQWYRGGPCTCDVIPIYIYIYMYFPLTENGEDSGIGEGHVRVMHVYDPLRYHRQYMLYPYIYI